MIKYQGEDIEFRLLYKVGENFTITDWSGFQEIRVLLYTDGCYMVKYSSKNPTPAVFNKLTLVDAITYSGLLQNKETKLLAHGFLVIEIKGVLNNNEICISKEKTGIYFENNFIKNV